jgi:TRAP-type C4-dicarboxylate transport system permease small subunit
MTSLRRLSDGLNQAVLVACVALITVMFAISLAGIATQAVTGSALTWSYSLTRLFVPWIAMLSLTVAFKRGEHIAMAMLLKHTPRSVRRFAQIVSLALIGLFGAALAWFGYAFFIGSTQLFMISDFLQVSHRWVTAAVPISGAILCVHLADGAALLGTDGAIDIEESV